MKILNYKIKNSTRGFSLFIAMVVMSALLLVAFAISNLASKEVIFSTYNRESEYAFFAADGGIECALYWDVKVTTSKFDVAASGSPIDCAGISLSNNSSIAGTSTLTVIGGPEAALRGNQSVFGYVQNFGSNPVNSCAIVSVYKNPDGSTHIYSWGYNNCNISDPRRVERGIEVQY